METVRVIVCTHNGVQFVEEQLASIMNQQRAVDVVHVFDFASTDGTGQLLRQLAARWSQIQLEFVDHAPGVTLSFFHAFRSVIRQASADDVIFLSDQDDVWLPNKVPAMLQAIASARALGQTAILAFHDVTVCDAHLRPLRKGFYDGKPFRLPRDIDRQQLLIANPVIGHTIAVTPQLLALAVSCFRPARYLMHDWALVLLAAYTGHLHYVPQRLGLYRQHEANVLGVGRKRSLLANTKRAAVLSRSIGKQIAAFQEDLNCVAENGGALEVTPLLPGRSSLQLRLASLLLRRGPTLQHRMMAVFPLGRAIAHRRS